MFEATNSGGSGKEKKREVGFKRGCECPTICIFSALQVDPIFRTVCAETSSPIPFTHSGSTRLVKLQLSARKGALVEV